MKKQRQFILWFFINNVIALSLIFLSFSSFTQDVPVKILSGHTLIVNSVSFSPDGKYLASGSWDNTIKLWEVSTGNCIKTMDGHTYGINSVSFSPDGKYLASGSWDNTIKLWEVNIGSCIRTISMHANGLISTNFSPDGKYLASGSGGSTIKLWEVSTGSCTKTLEGHTEWVQSVSFSPDGKYLASGSWDYTIKLWEMSMGSCIKTLAGHRDRVQSVSFSPDGKYLASGSHDNTIKLWEVSTGSCTKTLEGHTDWVQSVSFSPDGKYLASGELKKIKIWEISTGSCIKTLGGLTDWVKSVSFSPDGKYLASGSNDNTIILWDVTQVCQVNIDIPAQPIISSPKEEKYAVIEKEIEQKEIIMKEVLEQQTKEKLNQNDTTKNIQTEVKTEVVEQTAENGKKELNLKVEYKYNVIKALIEKQTDDYPIGEYNLNHSKAAKVILSVLKNTVENQLAEYLMPQTKVTVKITGSTDAMSITGKILYGGEYGEFKDEFCFINGMLDNITINKESGITSNEQLAFLRTFGVRNFIENYVTPLRTTDNRYEHYAVVADKRGAEYRRISIELIIHRAFDSKYQIALAKETLPETRGSGDPLKGLNVASAANMQSGNYYGLIIGIDNYRGTWLPLKNAVSDAAAVETLLKTKYRFERFRGLYNERATRKNIMQELQWLVDSARINDNVFIFFSGHGEFKQDLNKGFWVPVEAQTAEPYELISNNDIQTYLNAIPSKHTLLVSDACFSGDIFRGKTLSVPFEQSAKYYGKVYSLKSRQALTSGGVEPVMDGGREGHSVFTWYFLEMLRKNEDQYYDAGQLYEDIKIPVTNNSDQTPLLQPVKNTGDEGGQFIFIKK